MDNPFLAAQAARRAALVAAVAERRLEPLVIPYSLLGVALPVLWLAIPHVRRPWLYRSRWLVMAVVVAFNLHVIRHTSSPKPAFAYVTGMMAAWGTISNLNLLIWSRPQFDAARAVRLDPRQPLPSDPPPPPSKPSPSAEEPRQRRNGSASVSKSALQDHAHNHAHNHAHPAEPVFVWQPFPADGPFLQRLGWAADVAFSFRGSGWNWSISSIPRPKLPRADVKPGQVVPTDSIPRVSRSGYERCLTDREFVRRRLISTAIFYLILDFGSVLVSKDPFLVFGPAHAHEAPSYLNGISRQLLLAYREAITMIGLGCAIQAYFGLQDLFQYWFLKFFFPSRAAPWLHASVFGGVSQILDRGLAGLWGASWHQTFRHQFVAPANYLITNGYLDKGSLPAIMVAAFVSFLQSGLLHAAGTMTATMDSQPWRPVVFFLLQMVGIFVEQMLQRAVATLSPKPPRAARRVVNVLFVLSWLFLTGIFFTIDFAATRVWLTEPVPVSVFRWLGLGHAGDHWWRWGGQLISWHSGVHWWESGIAI